MKAPYLYTRELMGLMTALVMTTGLNACTGYDSVEDHLKDATVYIEAEGSIREPGGTMVQSMSGTGFFVTGAFAGPTLTFIGGGWVELGQAGAGVGTAPRTPCLFLRQSASDPQNFLGNPSIRPGHVILNGFFAILLILTMHVPSQDLKTSCRTWPAL